jgi:hypothetical protein
MAFQILRVPLYQLICVLFGMAFQNTKPQRKELFKMITFLYFWSDLVEIKIENPLVFDDFAKTFDISTKIKILLQACQGPGGVKISMTPRNNQCRVKICLLTVYLNKDPYSLSIIMYKWARLWQDYGTLLPEPRVRPLTMYKWARLWQEYGTSLPEPRLRSIGLR